MEFDFNNMPDMDLFAKQMSNTIAAQHEQLQASFAALESVQMAEEERKEEARQAAIETAENTAEIKGDMKQVIHNQNNYIKMLEYQNQLLKNMFASGEDGVAVQKEIMKILKEQGETNSTFKDKELDAGIQAVFLGIQIWLKSRGIDF